MSGFTTWLGRIAVGAAAAHLVLLAALPLYGQFAYGDIYERVSPREVSTLRDSYLSFLRIGGAAIALTLAAGSAAYGLWRRSPGAGILALLGGTVLTMALLSPLPRVYFPNDEYPAPAAWMFGNGRQVLLLWALLSLAGWTARRRPAPPRPAGPNHGPEPAGEGGRG